MYTTHLAKVFEKPSYRRYWLAYSLSALGFELVSFALMVVLFDITRKAVSMGAFMAIYMFCLVVFGPPAGIYIDRWNRKKIFIVCNLLLALLISTLKFFTGLSWIYFSWFLASLFLVFLRPARVALITNLFHEEDYLQANSAFMMSLNFSKIGGPLIGGILLIYFSREWTINVILSFFLVSSLLASTIPFRKPPAKSLPGVPSKHTWRKLAAGIRFLLSHERLRFYISIGLLWRLFLASQLPLYIVFVKNYLGGGTREYSLFMTVLSAGGAVGSLLAGGMGNRFSRKTMIYGGLGASYLLFALMPLSQSYLFALVLIGLSNLFFFIAHVAIHSDIQRVTTDEIRGSVFASSPTLLVPIGLISLLIATPLADMVGVQWVFLFTGLLALLTLPLPGYASKIFRREIQPTQEVQPAS
jgi:DHA3 family macrolide efflux protein-like MFS transporter